jgi:hypothetical protein
VSADPQTKFEVRKKLEELAQEVTGDGLSLTEKERLLRKLNPMAADIFYQTNERALQREAIEAGKQATWRAIADKNNPPMEKPLHARLDQLRKMSPTAAGIFERNNAFALRLERGEATATDPESLPPAAEA